MTTSKHRRSSSLGAILTFFKPNGADTTRALRNEFHDGSPHTATDLVFGIIDQANDQPLAASDSDNLDSQEIYKDWLQSETLDLALRGFPPNSGPTREQSRDGHSPEVPKRSKGLKNLFNPKKILEKGSDLFKRLRKDEEKSRRAHIYHHSNQSMILPQQPNTEPTRLIFTGTSQQTYEDKKFARHHRRSMKQSDDYLGVRGANPRTGLWDSSDSSTSYKNETPDFDTRLRRGYWIASDNEWNVVKETCLSPISQSVRSNSMRGNHHPPMPSTNHSSYNNLDTTSQGLISMLCEESHRIPRKPVGTTPTSTQENGSSTETVIHEKGGNAATESIQPSSDNNDVSRAGRPSKEAKAEMYKQGRFPGNTRWAAQTLGLKPPREPATEDSFLGMSPYEKITTAVARKSLIVRSEHIKITTLSRELSQHGEIDCHSVLHQADLYTTTNISISTIIGGQTDGTPQRRASKIRIKHRAIPGEGDLIRKEISKYFPSGRLRLREEGVVVEKKGLRLKVTRPQ